MVQLYELDFVWSNRLLRALRRARLNPGNYGPLSCTAASTAGTGHTLDKLHSRCYGSEASSLGLKPVP